MLKNDIRNLTREDLKKIISKMGEPAYRADQIFFWLYKKGIKDLDEMKNIPKPLRDKLKNEYSIGSSALSKRLHSKDKCEKFIFELLDNNFIETVLIKSRLRNTVCISTQVGCKFGCKFCASGYKGFMRNLSVSEIVSQILFLLYDIQCEITNYVFMGMGEPLDNYDNLIKAISIINDPKGIGAGARRITVSTCGIIPGIEKLKNFPLQINLSISLHATNDFLRSSIMPINKKYPLEKLMRTCESYIENKKRILTLEYVLIRDVNDSKNDAEGLAAIAGRLRAKVNIIPYSVTEYARFEAVDKERISRFIDVLQKNRVNVTCRESKGKDIKAACGQLAGNSI